MRLSLVLLDEYADHCRVNGQSEDTIKVKIRNLRFFVNFCIGKEVTPSLMSSWREYIMERYTKPYSRNNMVCKTNVFLDYLGLSELKIKSFEVERQKLYSKSKEGLTIEELKKMLEYTEETENIRMNLLLRLLAITGIRSGELHYITVEAVDVGVSEFTHHKKPRKVLLPNSLCKLLKDYVNANKILSGPIFLTQTGNPIHQRNVGTELKKIASMVDIPKDKINPTAFRILFANTYYKKYGDLSGLTDLLGVKNLNMAVLYIKEEDTLISRLNCNGRTIQ